jgi:hypothetical protein
MKRILINLSFLLLAVSAMAWSAKGDKIKTEWAEKVTPESVWQEYPRPQLKRAEWTNLNGLWNYSVTNSTTQKNAVSYQDEILVPFAIESALSGVNKTFTSNDKLWYKRDFILSTPTKGRKTILHFGAVDYECSVWVNNKLVGTHKGGNNSFSFDITQSLKPGAKQTIEVGVTDPTDEESITRGKQQMNQVGIWYTPVSGIWQTVWIETVNPTYINSILPQADLAQSIVNLGFDIVNLKGNETINIKVIDDDKVLTEVNQKVEKNIRVKIPNQVQWTPATPKLYGLQIELRSKNVVIDKVSSYFAMREVTMNKDEVGYNRIFLNGKSVFNYGTLDQGWWPDGLLTPPSAEAMLWDMVQLKDMGFNTIRKHIKVEPALYYYYADSLGLMIWQDMPSGFATARKKDEHLAPIAKVDWNAPATVVAQWRSEINEMIDNLRFFPSITTWVVFNEGWGQHNTKVMVDMVMQKDRSRIINGVSGWTDRKVGHMYDVHNYPLTSIIKPVNNNNRVSVLGEFGGLGLPVKDHIWNPEMRNWGYKNIDQAVDLISDYSKLVYDLESLIAQGAAAAIYTQTTDVEGEVNGLITYDRKVTKIPVSYLHQIHSRLYNVKSAKHSILIADAQEGLNEKRMVEVNNVKHDVVTPFEIKGESVVKSTKEFTVNELFGNLALWLNMSGETKVWLNGTLVMEQPIRQTRHYNQINISNYAYLLKSGINRLDVEVVSSARANMKFDFGLTAF